MATDKGIKAAALLLVFLVATAQPAFGFWPFWGLENSEGLWDSFFSSWLWGKPEPYASLEPTAQKPFDELEEQYGSQTAEFAKKIDKRFGKSLTEGGLRGIAEILEEFPEGNGKAVLETMTDAAYGLWNRQDLEEIAELDASGELENFCFKGSQFAKIGEKTVDGVARASYKNFFIETSAVRDKLKSASFLYSKVVRQSKKFKEAWGQDTTLVIVLRNGTALEKREMEKTLWKAFEKSANLDMQNITRIALYDESKEKTVTVYSKQDWVDGKP